MVIQRLSLSYCGIFCQTKYFQVVFDKGQINIYCLFTGLTKMISQVSDRPMESKEFIGIRKKLNKTQKELALLLGTSLKTVRSYEQGWRNIPTHAERQLYLLISRKNSNNKQKPCWFVKKCPSERKEQCPAWEFQAGKLCWFVCGTICEGTIQKNWDEKMEICRSCEIYKSMTTSQMGSSVIRYAETNIC